MVMEHAQRLDDVARTMNIIINGKLTAAHGRIDALAMFPNILQNKMAAMNQSVAHLGQMLNSLSYKNVLARGYAIARDANDKIISRADGAPRVTSLEFADGVLRLD